MVAGFIRWAIGLCSVYSFSKYLGKGAPDGQDGVGRHGARRFQIFHGAQPRDAVAPKDGVRGTLVDQDDGEPRERGAL